MEIPSTILTTSQRQHENTSHLAQGDLELFIPETGHCLETLQTVEIVWTDYSQRKLSLSVITLL